jgi:hypothetical protein
VGVYYCSPYAGHYLFERFEQMSAAALYSWDRLMFIIGPMYNIAYVYSIAGLWRVACLLLRGSSYDWRFYACHVFVLLSVSGTVLYNMLLI